MLILKTEMDLPISIRNLGHSAGAALKRLEMIIEMETDLSQMPDMKRTIGDHIFNMENISRNINVLGEPETFDLTKVYDRLAYLQEDYRRSAYAILNTIAPLQASDEDAFNALLPLCLNESDRDFRNELQLASMNRLEELQGLVETTAISSIAGLLRLNWSAKAFANAHQADFDQAATQFASDFREYFYENITTITIDEVDGAVQERLKLADDQMIEFCKSKVIPEVALTMSDTYDELFIANEDLTALKANAPKVAENCMLRGAAKKIILGFNDPLRDEISVEIADFIKKSKKASILESVASKANEIVVDATEKEYTICNHQVSKDGENVIVNILPVMVKPAHKEDVYEEQPIFLEEVYLGETSIDLKIEPFEKKVAIIKSTFDVSDILAHDEMGSELHPDPLELTGNSLHILSERLIELGDYLKRRFEELDELK